MVPSGDRNHQLRTQAQDEALFLSSSLDVKVVSKDSGTEEKLEATEAVAEERNEKRAGDESAGDGHNKKKRKRGQNKQREKFSNIILKWSTGQKNTMFTNQRNDSELHCHSMVNLSKKETIRSELFGPDSAYKQNSCNYFFTLI